MTSSPAAGLRERKKIKTRNSIREHAMRLFEEQGYAATTVDQIAEAAEVSQSTFFRYFPTKEDVILFDEYDEFIAAAVRAQPAGVPAIEAIRLGIRDVFGAMSDAERAQEQRRQRLFFAVPELRARSMTQYAALIGMLAGIVAERAGLPADDFGSRVLAGAVIGAAIASTPDGLTSAYDFADFERTDRALRLLQEGLPLGQP